jgi:hypothetical protein
VLRQAEIEELGPRRREHHVARLKVAVNDPLAVRCFERVRDFDAIAQDLGERKRTARKTCSQRLTLQQLEHQIVDVMLAPDVVQAADVGVAERGDSLGLAGEPCSELRVLRQLRREHLNGYRAIQARVAGPIHLAHPPSPDEGQDFVRAKARTRLQGHVSR